MKQKNIYCAGPLFNDSEKLEMAAISDRLSAHNYSTFLPQRDGLEFANLEPLLVDCGISRSRAQPILMEAIFSLDVAQVMRCDGLVCNLNGRVPDEGAMVEVALAWSAGKPIVLYKNDARSMLAGNDNPMILGLTGFRTISAIEEIPAEFDRLFAAKEKGQDVARQALLEFGQSLAALRENESDASKIIDLLVSRRQTLAAE